MWWWPWWGGGVAGQVDKPVRHFVGGLRTTPQQAAGVNPPRAGMPGSFFSPTFSPSIRLRFARHGIIFCKMASPLPVAADYVPRVLGTRWKNRALTKRSHNKNRSCGRLQLSGDNWLPTAAWRRRREAGADTIISPDAPERERTGLRGRKQSAGPGETCSCH